MFRKRTLEEILLWAARNNRPDEARRVLAAGADVHTQHDAARRDAYNFGHIETIAAIEEGIQKQDAQREKDRLELERQQNPLRAGTGLTFCGDQAEGYEALLREAMAEQEQMGSPTRPRAPPREYVPLPQS